jgi:hypothetical protein
MFHPCEVQYSFSFWGGGGETAVNVNLLTPFNTEAKNDVAVSAVPYTSSCRVA